MKKGMKLTNFWHIYEVKAEAGAFIEVRTCLGECLEVTAITKLAKIAENKGYVFNKNKGVRGRWVHPETFDTMEMAFGKAY